MTKTTNGMEKHIDKIVEIFRELVGDRAEKLDGSHYPADVNDRITSALAEENWGDEGRVLQQDAVGFHLVDWQRNAAFIVAIVLFPEKFTNEEIRDEVDAFLIHAPAHVLEAARLAGYPVENIFSRIEND